jgi:hypothetical protein
MKPEHRAALLEIADAWIQCAQETERASDNGEDGASLDGSVSGASAAAI